MLTVQPKYRQAPFLDEKELGKSLGTGKLIFVCSMNDLWGKWIPNEWIDQVLEHCQRFDNTYLFQTKNPIRFTDFIIQFPHKAILGTTIETNRDTSGRSQASPPKERLEVMYRISLRGDKQTMVNIEPIMDFDLDVMVSWIERMKPTFVSIGADSRRCNLPEPPPDKIKMLIRELEKATEFRIKSNLARLVG